MERTVCEIFAGVGGFRCGLNPIDGNEKWDTVWFSQWEPSDRLKQWAWGCYTGHFGHRKNLDGIDTTNQDIAEVDKSRIPDFNLLCGGFPCQDYSVASTLSASKGIEGKKGALFWSIIDMVQAKKPAFILLENVDRLLKSPSAKRGRDFAIILRSLCDEGYAVEWRVINAADYGFQQRRRRIFIFAYFRDTVYRKNLSGIPIDESQARRILLHEGLFAKTFPVTEGGHLKDDRLPASLSEIYEGYGFCFEDSGIMDNGLVFTLKTKPKYDGCHITLGDILETGDVEESLFIPESRLYYTSPGVCNSDETYTRLPDTARRTWQYIKGGKKIPRMSPDGYQYIYSEGPMPMVDRYDKPARTLLTSEGHFSRTTHIVADRKTGKLRLLTPLEMERIQGFPDNWTRYCLFDGGYKEMPASRRRFVIGNALVVDLIRKMEPYLDRIFKEE